MPKKKALWKRETPCPVCETTLANYQFMAKSQVVVNDAWLVSHTQSVGNYDDYPDVLKTTVCPGCLVASNEYGFAVDDNKYFYRSTARHDQLKEYFKNTTDERFAVLASSFEMLEKESEILDVKNNRPAHTRTRATFEKIWSQREKYGVPFFTMMLQEPRDYITALVCFAVDRYCQLVRISFDNDTEPNTWDLATLKNTLEEHFIEHPLDMKQAKPRFYYIGTNYLQAIQFIEELKKLLDESSQEKLDTLEDEYWQEAYQYMKLSFHNDDLTAIPCELIDGGMNLLMAKLHYKFGEDEEGNKCLRFAKNYADNRLKQISNKTQQNFVNETDDLFKEKFAKPEEESEEAGS